MFDLKRTLTIFFTALYFIASSGVLFGQHICMGRVQESALFTHADSQCGMSMEMHTGMDGCCDNEWSLEIIEDDQQITAFQDAPNATFYLLFETSLTEYFLSLTEEQNHNEFNDSGPPDINTPELYLFYHNLKIPSGLQS